jgi:uncharacterized protein (DUF362 family)/ferredoxin
MPEVRRAVARSIELLPGIQDQFRAAGMVLLKPNLLSSRRGPDQHVNTHPNVVRAVAEILISEFGCDVAIGDSCGTMTAGSTTDAMKISGVEDVAGSLDVDLYNVDAQPRHVVACPDASFYPEFPLPANLDQFHLIVSLPKLKTHSLTYITCAVKNIFGLVPGAEKKRAHLRATRPSEFADLLCDLYSLVRPGAALVDGIVGMEGDGPAGGHLRRLNLIAAACDPVALDAFCCQVMGVSPLNIPLLRRCHDRGLGVADPGRIEIVGEPADAFAPGDFAMPSTYERINPVGVIPRWLLRLGVSLYADRSARIDQKACIHCGECAANCPSGAIAFHRAAEQYHIDRLRCISCYCCAEVCPRDAIELRPTAFRRAIERITSCLRSPGA